MQVYRVRCPKILFPFVAAWKGLQLQKEKKKNGQPTYDAVWSIMTYAGFAGLFLKLMSCFSSGFSSGQNQQHSLPFILTLQEGTPLSEIRRQVWFVYPLFWLMFKKADVVQAISHFLAAFGRDSGHPKEVVVVPNGVDLHSFSRQQDLAEMNTLKQTLGKKYGDVYLVTTSRLVKKNAIDDCIRALEYIPPHVSLLVIGVGEEEARLRDLSRSIGMRDRVIFLGFLPSDQIPLFLSISDIFVRPSRSEGFGNSFIEAMAAGIPVIATPVGGIPDFIDDHETGLFCRPDNPKSLGEAVMQYIENPLLCEKIVRQAHERVVARYGWDQVAREMKENVFKKVMDV